MASVTSASLPVVSSVTPRHCSCSVFRVCVLRSPTLSVGSCSLNRPLLPSIRSPETHPKKQVANVILRNLTSSKIVFRINCRRPTRYTIRPYVEYLEPNEARDVHISLVRGDPTPGRVHRFHVRSLKLNDQDGVGTCPSAYWMEKVDDGTVLANCDKASFMVKEPGSPKQMVGSAENLDANEVTANAASSLGMNTASWDDVYSQLDGGTSVKSYPLTCASTTYNPTDTVARRQKWENLERRVTDLERILREKSEEGGISGFLANVFEFQLKAALVGFAAAWALFAVILAAIPSRHR